MVFGIRHSFVVNSLAYFTCGNAVAEVFELQVVFMLVRKYLVSFGRQKSEIMGGSLSLEYHTCMRLIIKILRKRYFLHFVCVFDADFLLNTVNQRSYPHFVCHRDIFNPDFQ